MKDCSQMLKAKTLESLTVDTKLLRIELPLEFSGASRFRKTLQPTFTLIKAFLTGWVLSHVLQQSGHWRCFNPSFLKGSLL